MEAVLGLKPQPEAVQLLQHRLQLQGPQEPRLKAAEPINWIHSPKSGSCFLNAICPTAADLTISEQSLGPCFLQSWTDVMCPQLCDQDKCSAKLTCACHTRQSTIIGLKRVRSWICFETLISGCGYSAQTRALIAILSYVCGCGYSAQTRALIAILSCMRLWVQCANPSPNRNLILCGCGHSVQTRALIAILSQMRLWVRCANLTTSFRAAVGTVRKPEP